MNINKEVHKSSPTKTHFGQLQLFPVICFLKLIMLFVLQARFDEGTPSEIHSKINLVDLAGRYV